MTPFRFGPPKRRLYGVFHQGGLRRPSAGVVLCNPYGQEAIRTHRLYRLLADRLSRSGISVLRFDYYATGESDGDDAQGEMQGWSDDLLLAHAEMLARTRCERVVWVGARLGATVALLASVAAARAPDHLVLWEPVVDGRAYARELGHSNAKALHDPMRPASDRPMEDLGDEATGFSVGSAFRSQLLGLELGSLPSTSVGRCTVMAQPSDPAAAALAERLRSQQQSVFEVAFSHQIVWGDEEAMNTALAPSDAIEALELQITNAIS